MEWARGEDSAAPWIGSCCLSQEQGGHRQGTALGCWGTQGPPGWDAMEFVPMALLGWDGFGPHDPLEWHGFGPHDILGWDGFGLRGPLGWDVMESIPMVLLGWDRMGWNQTP